MKKLFLVPVFLMAIGLLSCSKTETDQTYPEINMDEAGAFPLNCDTMWIGQSFSFKALLHDNNQLGSYSLEIHNNFDHHTHSTDVAECTFEPDKTPVNPFLFIQEYPIPEGLQDYSADRSITIPVGVDPGDYHFMIRLTDAEGWQTIKGISVKLADASAN